VLPALQSATGLSEPRERDLAGPTIACALLFAIGLQLTLNAGITTGDVLLVLTGALWFPAYRQYSGAALFLGWGLITAVAGVMLSEYTSTSRMINASGQRDSTILMVGLVGSVAAVLWARSIMSNSAIGISYGLGMVIGAGLHPGSWSTNPWKFAFGAPVSVLVLGIAIRTKRPALGIVPLLLLALVSLALDCRAFSVTLLLAAFILFWRCLPKRESLRYGWLSTAALIALAAGLVYLLASSLLVSGYLGKDVQARSVEQIQTSGSLILGGRPEIAATWALMKHDIAGFGVGAVPTPNDVLVAKRGLTSINYDPNNGYVERYLFGGHFELHSVIGDMWASWGIAGIVLVLLTAYIVVRTLSECVARRHGDALLIYLCLWTLWNLLFSPIPPALPILVLAVGLGLHPKARAEADADRSVADAHMGAGVRPQTAAP
jgi:hypothetical protein